MRKGLTTQVRTTLIIGVYLFSNQTALAAALFEHIVQPYVGTELIYDSNVLRLPNHFTAIQAGNHTRTDSFIKKIKAGLSTKWLISQQELIADVSINQNWYSTFDELNYTGYNALGKWNWRLGQSLRGELSYNNRLTLGSFQQINRLVNNLENREIYTANGNYEFSPDWFLHAKFMRLSFRYPSLLRQLGNSVETSQEYGMRYLNQADNLIDFYVTLTDGEYTSRPASSSLDNAYSRINYRLDGKWNYSIKTQIKAQIGYTSQEYEHIKSRNFADIVASADILWAMTPKSSLLLSAWREISPTDDLRSTFSLNHGVRLTPTWTWSENPKIQIELPISYNQQTTFGATGFTINGITTDLPKSNLSTAGLNINYTPIPNTEISAFVLYENRHSSSALHTYQDYSLGLTVKVSF